MQKAGLVPAFCRPDAIERYLDSRPGRICGRDVAFRWRQVPHRQVI